MTPYYEDTASGIVIYHGDCLEVLPLLPSADLLMTDPPYAISFTSNHTHKPGKGTRRLNFFEGDTDWDEMTEGVVMRVMMAAALVPAAYVWCGHRQFGQLVSAFEKEKWNTRFLVWRKLYPVPAAPGVGWDSAAELCVYAFREGRKWTPPTGTKCPNFIEADSYRHGQPGKVNHPTQKPLATAVTPMMFSTAPGDLILDPFMGSGTTLVAAKELGRRAIGIEIEQRFCEVAVNRLRQEVLFGAA